MTKSLAIATAFAAIIVTSGCNTSGGCGSPQFNNILKSEQLRRDRNWCDDD